MTPIDTQLPPESPADQAPPARRGWRSGDIARAATVVLAVWFGFRLFWTVSSFVFLVFLATLFGLAVGRGVDYLERFGIRRGIASALIVFGALGAIGGGLSWTAPTLIEQGKELQREFPQAIHKLQTWLDSKRDGFLGSFIISATQTGASPAGSTAAVPLGGRGAATAAGAPATDRAPQATPSAPTGQPGAARGTAAASPADAIRQRLAEGTTVVARYLFSFVSSTLAVITAFVLMVFLAMYIGAEPQVYRGWILAVVPAASRAHVRVVLAEVATVLRKWLVTQLIAMVVIGVVCMIVLLVLGVKAAFALAFIAGLMEFIPTVGPILSAVPAVLMGFVDSPEKALAVAIAYWGIQFLENNLLIPFLMRGEMDLPPAITLVAQTLMTLLFGFVGLMVAVPLTAAVLVPLRMVADRENIKERAMIQAARRAADASESAAASA